MFGKTVHHKSCVTFLYPQYVDAPNYGTRDHGVITAMRIAIPLQKVFTLSI